MSSREKILGNILKNKPALAPLPLWATQPTRADRDVFIKTLRAVGGDAIIVGNLQSVKEAILNIHGDKKRFACNISSLSWGGTESYLAKGPDELEKIDVTVIEGHVGVAENAAIWVNEQSMGARILPFICQHLMIVLPAREIVATMHDAYSLIQGTDSGFDVFISGPSKTADIEQSLVIGAHGARSLTVLLVEN